MLFCLLIFPGLLFMIINSYPGCPRFHLTSSVQVTDSIRKGASNNVIYNLCIENISSRSYYK